jgi:hypothetical protein
MSVNPRGTILVALDGFSLNLMMTIFLKNITDLKPKLFTTVDLQSNKQQT